MSFQVESTVTGARPFDCEFVGVIDSVDKVICVVLGELLYTEFVDAKGEGCFASVLFPESWGVLHWVISKGCNILENICECNDAGFFEAVHSLEYLEVVVSVGFDG